MFAECGMVVIGIAGGVASGKSLVARQLEQLGATRLDADQIGHEVLLEDNVKRALRQRWGDCIFLPSGVIDRRAVAKIVFADSPAAAGELKFLEQQTHPLIKSRLKQKIADLKRAESCPAAVLDAAVMFKAGWDRLCDRIVFVDAPLSARRTRVLNRRWTETELAAREAAQSELDEKRRRADWVIDNSGTVEATFEQVQEFWNQL